MFDSPRAVSIDRLDVVVVEEKKFRVRRRLGMISDGSPGGDSDHRAEQSASRTDDK